MGRGSAQYSRSCRACLLGPPDAAPPGLTLRWTRSGTARFGERGGQTRRQDGGTIERVMREGLHVIRRAFRAGAALCRRASIAVAIGSLAMMGALVARAQEAPAAAGDPSAGTASEQEWLFKSTSEEFVVSNAQFVLMHELAHLVIDEKRVPILGPEESAADYIAAMMLIRPRTTPPEGRDALIEVAVNTADGFAIEWQRRERLGRGVPYWDSHSLTVQRFSTLACLLYGSDPDRFAALLKRVDMPAVRARTCIRDYEHAAYAIDWLFDTFARKEGDPPGVPVGIRFEQPPTRTSERMLAAIREEGFVERTLEFFNQVVALDAPATFVMRSCRQPQAMWVPATRELVFCYELLDAYAAMSLERRAEPADALRLTAPRD
jgi:hypothetical protein